MQLRSALSETTQRSGQGLVAIWLIALYFGSIATALLAFSGLQFQMALSADSNTSIGQLQLQHASFRQREESLRQTSEALFGQRAIRNDIFEQIAAKESRLSQLFAERSGLIDTVGRKLVERSGDRSILTNFRSDPDADADLFVMQLVAIKRAEPAPSAQEIEQIDKLLLEIDTNVRELYATDAALNSLRQQLEARDRAIGDQEHALTARQEEPTPEPLVVGLFQQLQFFGSIPGGIHLATMPPSLLIPIVTLAMGALGSVIQLSDEVVEDRRSRGFVWYVFRPMLGMVTAFAVFIVIQAGALVVTTPTGSAADETQINAYFIAFVAILSGMLSEQAVGTLRDAGTKLLGERRDEAPADARTTPEVETAPGGEPSRGT